MKKLFFRIFIFLFPFSGSGQNSVENLSIIPQPVSMVSSTGYYILHENIVVEIKPGHPDVDAIANLRVISYRNGKPIGRMITIPVAELKKRVL